MSYLDALQTTLAAEHAAVYVYGYLGAQTSQSAQPVLAGRLDDAYAVHLARRDVLVALVDAEHATPVASLAAYDLPVVGSVAAVSAAALHLEKRCAATYDFLVGTSPSGDRRRVIEWLVDAAVRRLGFGGAPETYPGR